MAEETALVWFRRDLGLHDNPALTAAAECARVLSVYCVDPRECGRASYGGSDSFEYVKTGPYRARFRTEALADPRSRLRTHGSDLAVREGRPEEVLPDLASTVGADVVHAHTWPTAEEATVERDVRDGLAVEGIEFRRHWGHTLHHPRDLAGPIGAIDVTFTNFRKAVESDGTVRDPLGTPSLPWRPDVAPGDLPSVEDLLAHGEAAERDHIPGAEGPEYDDRGGLDFEGGETAGLQRLDAYVWEHDELRRYEQTRTGLLGADYSSKLSRWLNEGCLSPRRAYETVQEYEDERVAYDSTYWLVFELRWRDFFQFQFAKHGPTFWTKGGIQRRDVDWRDEEAALRRWKRGETGVPFVDANMRELAATGYMSNRGRQNAASFLANDLRVDWRRGAAHFERLLVDYDPCSNYGNWAYVARVGNDSRNRSFDVISQARRYDGDAEYVHHWLPELEPLPPEYAHEPWQLTEAEQAEYGVELGVDYPEPMADPATLS